MHEQKYPMSIGGVWVTTPLKHAKMYADRADREGESYVAVPASLLRRLANFRECGNRKVFHSDEDGPIAPFSATCRKEAGHDTPGELDHISQHSNGYYVWDADKKDNT